jgi:hypothetical protein
VSDGLLVGIIGKDEVGKCISLSFREANPATRLFGTARREGVIDRVEAMFEATNCRKAGMSVG